MDDFLHFLNTADIDSLTKVSGITSSVAENLVAARPFDTVEDCLKVRGIGKNTLARAQSAFENMAPDPEQRAVIPAEQAVAISAIQKPEPTYESTTAKGPSLGTRVGQALLGFLRALLRLILLVMVIGVVGAAIYYGTPVLYNKFIAPVEQNAARVNELENEVASLQSQLTEMNNQLTEINSQIDTVEQAVKAHTASLEKLETIQTALESELKDNHDQAVLDLKREVMLTRILDILARARLYLAQSNFGLAKEDVQASRDLLAELNSASNNVVYTQATTRLDQALENLPEFPVVASGDLEIAWQILITGKTVATATAVPTSTALPTSVSTLEATATPTAIP